MSKNLQKNSISLEDLGWPIYDKGSNDKWDGLSQFFIEQCDKNTGLLTKPYFKQWYNAVKQTSLQTLTFPEEFMD